MNPGSEKSGRPTLRFLPGSGSVLWVVVYGTGSGRVKVYKQLLFPWVGVSRPGVLSCYWCPTGCEGSRVRMGSDLGA